MNHYTIRFLFLIVFLLFFCSVKGQEDWNLPWTVIGDSADLKLKQNVIITGKIRLKTGEPVVGASISVETFKYFDYSDQLGSYVLELPPGRYRVTVKHVGMKSALIRLRVLSGGLLNVDMEEGATDLQEIIISSRPIDSNIKQSLSGLTKLNVQEIRTLPTLMGEVDILKTLQLMPGVSSIGEGSSGFNVRGGRMDQNLILLNDVPLFNTSHAL